MRKAFLAFGIVVWGALFSLPAVADQCAYVSIEEAEKAQKALQSVSEVIFYCEPCQGDTPRPVRIQTVEVKKIDNKTRYVHVNGSGIDLAYTFIPSNRGQRSYDNLARRAGCEAGGISSVITYPPDETKKPSDWSGVYERGSISWRLEKTSGPDYSIRAEFTETEGTRHRGTLSSYAQIENGKMTFQTPLASCQFILTRKGKSLNVRATSSCGGIGSYLAGSFGNTK